MNRFCELCIKSTVCLKNSKGQTIIEYCLILVLIAIIVIAMLTGVGSNSNKAFSTINSTLN
jgi:pilus assembly protein Flp/PilA